MNRRSVPRAKPAGPPEAGQAGLTTVFASEARARARHVERLWRWPTMLVLLSTVPSYV